MNPKIKRQLDAVDDQLQKLVSRLSRYSEEDLNRKPSDKEWSVMQVMVHLRMAEFYTRAYMEKKFSDGNIPRKNGLKGKIMPLLYPLLFNAPIKVKSPALIGDEVLPEKSSFWDVTKQWKTQRADLRIYLEQLTDRQLQSEVYRHPIFGRSDAFAMLKFYKLHTDRHIKQINRLLSYYKC